MPLCWCRDFSSRAFFSHEKAYSAASFASAVKPDQNEETELLKLVDSITKLTWDAVNRRIRCYTDNEVIFF